MFLFALPEYSFKVVLQNIWIVCYLQIGEISCPKLVYLQIPFTFFRSCKDCIVAYCFAPCQGDIHQPPVQGGSEGLGDTQLMRWMKQELTRGGVCAFIIVESIHIFVKQRACLLAGPKKSMRHIFRFFEAVADRNNACPNLTLSLLRTRARLRKVVVTKPSPIFYAVNRP